MKTFELKKRNRFKELFYNIYNEAEGLAFSILLKLPENLIRSSLLTGLTDILQKEIASHRPK